MQIRSPKFATPSFDTAAEVQLCVMVSPAVRAQVRAAAVARGLTLRALVLGALRDAGVLPDMPDTDLADRRAVLAAAKARLWREHGAAEVSHDTATDPETSRGQRRGRAGVGTS